MSRPSLWRRFWDHRPNDYTLKRSSRWAGRLCFLASLALIAFIASDVRMNVRPDPFTVLGGLGSVLGSFLYVRAARAYERSVMGWKLARMQLPDDISDRSQ